VKEYITAIFPKDWAEISRWWQQTN